MEIVNYDMKTYKEYLIAEYGWKEAKRLLGKRYIFDLKTTAKIKGYKPKTINKEQYEFKRI